MQRVASGRPDLSPPCCLCVIPLEHKLTERDCRTRHLPIRQSLPPTHTHKASECLSLIPNCPTRTSFLLPLPSLAAGVHEAPCLYQVQLSDNLWSQGTDRRDRRLLSASDRPRRNKTSICTFCVAEAKKAAAAAMAVSRQEARDQHGQRGDHDGAVSSRSIAQPSFPPPQNIKSICAPFFPFRNLRSIILAVKDTVVRNRRSQYQQRARGRTSFQADLKLFRRQRH